MRVLLDEDVPVQAIEPLRHLLAPHEVDHVKRINWAKKKDSFVFADAKRAGYDVLVTKNVGQLQDPDECSALKKSGLHHVTYEQKVGGLEGLGRALGAIFAAMPSIMRGLETAENQQLLRIVAVSGDRFVEIERPAYWPR